MKRIRSIGKYVLTTGLFVAMAAFALILARGNTITPQGISAIGTIRLNTSSTSNLKAYLDEQEQRVTSNRTIENVLPGTYQLRVQREGYSSWQQEVVVHAGLVTDVDFQLFPEELALAAIETKNVSQLYFSPDRTKMFYTVVDSRIGANVGLWQRDLQSGTFSFNQSTREIKLSNMVSTIRSAAEAKSLEIIPSPDNRKLLVMASGRNYIIDTDRYNEPDTTSLTVIPFPISKISWLRDSNNLLILSDNLLLDFDIAQQRSTVIDYNGASEPIYATTAGIVYFVRDGKLQQYSSGTTTIVKLVNVSLPSNISEVYAAKNNAQNLVIKSDTTLYFLNIEQSFIASIGSYNLVSMSPSGENLIVKRGDELFAVDILISKLFDSVEVSVTATNLPTDLAPKTIAWANSSSYMAFQTADNTKLFTSDQLGNNVTELLEQSATPVLSFGLTSDNAGLLVLLQEENRANIYQLDFNPDN